MKNGELALLLNEKNSFLVEVGSNKLHTQDGIIDLKFLAKKKIGDEIKSHLGRKFKIVKPTLLDTLNKRMKRLPQIIMTKDAAAIIANTGVMPQSLVVDAGTGSGFLTIFLANYLPLGKVVTYEKNKRFAKVAKENIKKSRLPNIKLKQKDITKGIDEKNVDLITLDMNHPEQVIKHAHRALVAGGWVVVYSPFIEQVAAVVKKLKRKNFSNIKVIENIVREWEVEKASRPKTIGLMHTGFLTFARKI